LEKAYGNVQAKSTWSTTSSARGLVDIRRINVQTSKITIPAVKITGAVTSLLPEDSMMLPAALCPDPCVSSSENKMEQDPVAGELKTHGLLLPDLEDEFGEFLLDACTWL
jgi:hypothetical protein